MDFIQNHPWIVGTGVTNLSEYEADKPLITMTLVKWDAVVLGPVGEGPELCLVEANGLRGVRGAFEVLDEAVHGLVPGVR
jgi:hypothetical protein